MAQLNEVLKDLLVLLGEDKENKECSSQEVAQLIVGFKEK